MKVVGVAERRKGVKGLGEEEEESEGTREFKSTKKPQTPTHHPPDHRCS